MPMLSVIVPIYNAERYLSECLNSIIQQDYDDLEILCINDGSTDTTLDILSDYGERDRRIIIHNKPNTGYGDSVNIGINLAKGEYISIVESDDLVVEGAFKVLIMIADQFRADVVKGNYYQFSKESGIKLYKNLGEIPKNEILDSEAIRQLFYTAPSVWSAIYRRRFLLDNNIRFLPSPGAAYQDTSFAFKIWANAGRVVAIDNGVIYYRTDNLESSSNESNKISEIQMEFKEIEKTIKLLNRNDLWPILVRVKYISYIWNMNRLIPEKKIQFLDSIYDEFVVARDNGFLDKSVWPESDWIVIQRLLNHFEKYKSDLLIGKAFWEAGM